MTNGRMVMDGALRGGHKRLSDRKSLFAVGLMRSIFLLPPLKLFFVILCLSLLVSRPSTGQQDTSSTNDAVELARLRFQRGLIEASLAPLKKHVLELATLEKERAESRDYPGAIAARQERRKVEDELERLDKELLLLQTREQSLKAAALPDRLPLALDQAELNHVRREGGTLTGWSQPGASATWKLPALPSGGYEVVIRYRCGPLDGGLLEVRESKFRLSSQIDTAAQGPQEKNLGTLKITDGSGTLTLAATTLVKDNLMSLMGLWLLPASK